MALRELGWTGFVQVVLFMTLLLAGYVYGLAQRRARLG